jgi:hypothetical protein
MVDISPVDINFANRLSENDFVFFLLRMSVYKGLIFTFISVHFLPFYPFIFLHEILCRILPIFVISDAEGSLLFGLGDDFLSLFLFEL